MKFYNLNNLFSNFVFLRQRSGRMPQMAAGEDEGEEDEKNRIDELDAQQRLEQEHRQQLESKIATAHVTPETRQMMRECVAAKIGERFGAEDLYNAVERLLNGETKENEFRQEVEGIVREERSWETIFHTQRNIRKQIQELQWKTESYVELIPQKKSHFDALLSQVKRVNRQDENTDRTMKIALAGLVPNPLTQAQAAEIYHANPIDGTFDRVWGNYRGRVNGSPDGATAVRKILALKNEEAVIMRRFNQLCDQLEKIIKENVSKVRLMAEKEQIQKNASRVVGITIASGTEIEFTEPENLAVSGRRNHATIVDVLFEPVETRDSKGKVISKSWKAPVIELDAGSGRARMTLARFKKWVDAVDAVEVIHNLSEIEKATELASYGIKICEGMVLTYPRRTKTKSGETKTTLENVRITQIDNANRRIHFDNPVAFQPGMEKFYDYDYRNSLTFGEFVKWWHRYEVEKSVSLEELRELLVKYNEIYNHAFGIPASENPPIEVIEGEDLTYMDDSGSIYSIEKVDPTGITIRGWPKKSLPEFFHWIKENHVQKKYYPKSPETKKAEEETKETIKREKEAKEESDTIKQSYGVKHATEREKFDKDRQASSLLGRLKEIWWTTQLLSFKDIYNVIKEIAEFMKRKHERRSKGRYGDVGSRLPWIIGPEFERVKQAAENEEVNKYKEAMEHWSIAKVKRTLYTTNSKDIAKACIMTLLHHGEMRWDDHEFHATLNRLTARYTLKGAQLYIPTEPHLIKPGWSGEDMSQPAMDALWGDGTAANWFQENISKYNSNKNNFEFKFKQLENDPKGTGGPAGECNRLLNLWLDGGYVNPQEYEEMIDGAIKYGKMTAEQKMFYIITGILARQGNRGDKNPHGETLLHIDRLGELDSKYLNQFPLLDYFTQVYVKDMTQVDPETGELGKKRKLQLKDYEELMRRYFPDDFKKCKPDKQFSRFMWEVMLMDEMVRTRISKGIRNAENMDHDDAHLYIPPTTPGEIDSILTGPSGQKKYFTNSGYANGYAGFNQYIVSLTHSYEEEDDEEARANKLIALRDTINAFIRYDAILDSRLFKKERERYARLDDRHFRRTSIVDNGSCVLQDHRNQLRNLVLKIGRAYGQDWDQWLYGEKTGSIFDKKEAEKQEIYERKIDSLKDLIPQLIVSDKGEKAIAVIKEAMAVSETDELNENGLHGISSSKRPKQEELTRLREGAVEYIRHGGAVGGH
ncbi:hypothetical protein HZC21_03130 [Candidatus Peregrinibacteria bacterium]|nr:hypothetical protein [Candidatus Peregrinibacteria bacterium]